MTLKWFNEKAADKEEEKKANENEKSLNFIDFYGGKAKWIQNTW